MSVLSIADFSSAEEMKQAYLEAFERDGEVEFDLSQGDEIVRIKMIKGVDGQMAILTQSNQPDFNQNVVNFADQTPEAEIVYKGPTGIS